jgi:hypothetical protein
MCKSVLQNVIVQVVMHILMDIKQNAVNLVKYSAL